MAIQLPTTAENRPLTEGILCMPGSHLLTCLLCSAVLLYEEVEAGKNGETGCVHQRPSGFSSL